MSFMALGAAYRCSQDEPQTSSFSSCSPCHHHHICLESPSSGKRKIKIKIIIIIIKEFIEVKSQNSDDQAAELDQEDDQERKSLTSETSPLVISR